MYKLNKISKWFTSNNPKMLRNEIYHMMIKLYYGFFHIQFSCKGINRKAKPEQKFIA